MTASKLQVVDRKRDRDGQDCTPNLPWIKARQPLGRRPAVTDIAIPIRTIDREERLPHLGARQIHIYDTKDYDAQLSSQFFGFFFGFI